MGFETGRYRALYYYIRKHSLRDAPYTGDLKERERSPCEGVYC